MMQVIYGATLRFYNVGDNRMDENNRDNIEKESVDKYMAKLKNIAALEMSLCRQEKVLEAYGDYTHVPVEPPPYRNRASLGMISLSATWVLFDVFAFFTGYTRIGIGASLFTGALILFFIILKLRGTRAYKKLMAEYEEYVRVYGLVRQLEETGRRTRRILEGMYEKSGVYSRCRNLNAVCALYDFLETGRASAISGPEGVYKLYDKEFQKGRIPDKSREIENDIASEEQMDEFCKEVNHLLDEMEERI